MGELSSSDRNAVIVDSVGVTVCIQTGSEKFHCGFSHYCAVNL